MSLKEQIDDCVKNNNLVVFSSLLAKHKLEELLPILCDNLFHIALFNAYVIANRVLEIPEVIEFLRANNLQRNTFIHTAMRSVDAAFMSRLLEIDFICVDIINNQHEYVLAVTENRNFAPEIFDILKNMINLEENLTANNCQAWYCAHVHYCYAAMNKMLELSPTIYEQVDAQDPKHHSGQDYINCRFMEYYFTKLNQRMADAVAFDVNHKEAKLCYLILKTLVRTYPERDRIQNQVHLIARISSHVNENSLLFKARESIKHLYEQYAGKENIHLERIKKLLAIPSVRRRLADNDNLILKLAQGQCGVGSKVLVDALSIEVDNAHKSSKSLTLQLV